MPFYHRLGRIPAKRHIQFRQEDGSLYREEVMGTKGFSGIQSILYHIHAPAQVREARLIRDWTVPVEEAGVNRHRHLLTFRAKAGSDPIDGRIHWLVNDDVAIATATPTAPMNYFFRNSDGDEVIFVHEGEGTLETIFGDLPYRAGDYLVIPVGTTYRLEMRSKESRFLVIESFGEITPPRRYRNEFGQLMEHSPYCERDIRIPEKLNPRYETGTFEVRVKSRNQLHAYTYDFHPLDVVGWDGYLYPWAFNIEDFEPITGSIHQPPPVHQTFAGPNFVVCSFVPRMYDYHPLAIPAPYFHSNVNSDEVLYYVKGNFMSRKGVNEGSITLHPSGLPHGPHPGKAEASIGKERTEELAVMVDTFKPLKVTKAALEIEDPAYMYSWLPE
ncbi:homogentisate 1,2-dioxygenase [Paenactinomyces guangxiensis]|uniref:Homogentisate 1,2-dioxygenase n=1 Tax=Paenactinomyces guangxiensis TaxID=1490290 RepID=A0A7W1WTF9_9BACL|nr:homogentisate 1,2-dioxygenase [Paenactinomyces guangxiensis]MBA4495735.1 homogentisate 1,2-dioxygenase [Paenactinomyces guangxiensis]MBH8592724.1 homogentisate 1,2-dioxygenase [Paenactinomyces guangxiensis]